jgi:CheY-like chemotaxis protein
MDAPSKAVNKRRNRAIIVAGARSRDVLSIALMLKHFDYDTTVVNSAVNIVTQIAAVQPALIINYLNVPGIKGPKLFDLLKEDRRTASIPMIFVVSPGDIAGEKLCYGIGGAGCVTRPVQVDDLYRIVQEIIEPRTRTSIRLDARLDVSINGVPLVCPDGPCRIDLSEHGMYVPSDKPLAPGKKVDVQIRIKDRDISAEGVVLHRSTVGRGRRNTSGMGIMFVKIDHRDQLAIRDFVRKEFSEGVNKDLAREKTD